MQSNTQVSFECAPCLNSLHHPVRDGDSTSIVLSSTDHVVPPKSAKKPTRQWAAWTRQEEESFFTALRQVGKNFEKITSRVQSKNKDQVRHYYYRLVRRMNKLLGPELSLDAKNSKDTIAAMLRWWSLLEKYSCKASKLHLKPRRFKVFIEALEHQLTKDKKKNVKRRHPQGESCSTISTTFTNQNKTSEEDSRSVKFILLDNQNIQKLATGKASSPKRMASLGINRSNSKGDSSAVKTSRQRRKPAGLVSSAAYKRWEKAAIAGVSLVADAAEHLERVVDDKEGMEQDIEKERFNPPGNILPSLPAFPPKVIADGNLQSCMKLKLQLFPIDEATRRALEMDKHNPHLELTLSNRKKISSVVDHLSRKWGSSSMSTGKLMLFPYSAERENLMNYQRWAIDSIISVADVYAMIGRPAIFRLRYGWMSIPELDSIPQQEHLASCHFSIEHNINVNCGNGDPINASKDELPSAVQKYDVSTYLPNGISRTCVGVEKANVVPCQQGVNVVWQRERENETVLGHTEDEESLRLRNVAALSSGEWADSLTNVSVGDLLSEATPEKNVDCTNTPVAGSSQCQQIPFTCDSFDAAIAAHLYRHQVATNFQSNLASSESSIWDAEVACDGFSFKKNIDNCQEVAELPFTAFSGVCEPVSRNNSARSCNLDEELPEIELPTHSPTTEVQSNEHPTETHFLESSVKEFGGIADMYWPDSLGPLELEVPSCRYHSEDLILSDSLCGLNNLIASSLDAFQNCSFFGIDKKEGTSMTVEGQKSAPFSDFKIGNGV